MKFEIEVTTEEHIYEERRSNLMGTRFAAVTTLRGEDGHEYRIYVDQDYNESVYAVPC